MEKKEGEIKSGQSWPKLLLLIVFDVCLFADYKVFDEMAERNSNLNFGFKLGGLLGTY